MKVSRPVRIFAWALIIASFPMWIIAITATPFFPLPAAQRVVTATVIAVVGEPCSGSAARFSGRP